MSLSAAYKVLLTAGIVLLNFVGFCLMEYQQKWEQLDALEERLATRQLVLEEKRAKDYALQESAEEIERLEQDLSQLLHQEQGRQVGDYVEALQEMAAETYHTFDLAIESVTPLPSSGPEGYYTQDFQMHLSGRYYAVEDFLYQMDGLSGQQLVAINGLEIRSGKGGRLSLTMPMRAYLGGSR